MNLTTLLFAVPTVLIALTVHEYFHALAADRCGDPTPRAMGRLSLNPMRHFDPIGALCMLFLGFGWATPVPVNSRNFKNPRRDMAWVAAAGPLSNLFLSLIGAFLYLACASVSMRLYHTSAAFLFRLAAMLANFFYVFHFLNLSFCLFNLIPITPLDGSRILSVFLPPKFAFWLIKNERTLYFVFLGWLLIGSMLYRFILPLPAVAGNAALTVIVKILSLVGILTDAVQTLSGLILKLFSFFPFL